MTEAVFYKLTDKDRITTLRSILVRSRERGWRVAVRCNSDSDALLIDHSLWKAPDDGFLPHGRMGGEFDQDQPILILTDSHAPNRPDALVLMNRYDVDSSELSRLQRVCVLFDGRDERSVGSARQLSGQLTDAGVNVVCWVNENGAWFQRQEP